MIANSSQREECGRDQLKSGCGRNTSRSGVPSRNVSEMIWHEATARVGVLSLPLGRNRAGVPAVAVTLRSLPSSSMSALVSSASISCWDASGAANCAVIPLPGSPPTWDELQAAPLPARRPAVRRDLRMCSATCANVRRPSRSARAAVSNADATIPPIITRNTRPCIDVTNPFMGRLDPDVGAQYVPSLRTVLMSCGSRASSSSFCRTRLT